MADVDIEALTVVAEKDGLASVYDVAERLSVPNDEARSRLEALVRSGHLAGPVWVGFLGSDEDWDEAGYGLMSAGRDVLKAEKDG